MSNLETKQCEGMRRHGGAFTCGGTPEWVQCKEAALCNLTVKQKGKTSTLPACMGCWNESSINDSIEIIAVTPLNTKLQIEETTNA